MSIKKILFIYSLNLCFALKCEYIVFRKSNNNIKFLQETPKSSIYSKIYGILLTYQWPTCIACFHKTDQNEIANFTMSGRSLEDFIRIKIQEIDKNFDIAFIPTFIYELFFIANYETYKKRFDLINFNCSTYIIATILADPKNNTTDIFNYFSTLNNSDFICNIHWTINNELINYIKKFEFYTQQRTSRITDLIKDNIDDVLLDLVNQAITPWNKIEICKKIVTLEYEAHQNNFGIIYRGSKNSNSQDANLIEFTLFNSNYNDANFASRSISFGNSIFAGYLRDKGACAGSYIIDNTSVGYSLFIDKWLYYKGLYFSSPEEKTLSPLIDGKLFTISPLSTISALFGNGILFHSRSKSYCDEEQIKFNNNAKITIPCLERISDFIGYFLAYGNPLQKSIELSQFIMQRAQLIKVPDNQGGFHFSTEIEKSYFSNQSSLGNNF